MQRGRMLGKGAFGRVYALLDGSDITMVGKFAPRDKYTQLEIDIHKSLQHPNVVSFLKQYHYNATSLMCLEYCPHGTLADVARKNPTNQEIVFYLRQLQSALVYVHGAHIIHRDVKLPNLLLKGAVVKLADFGLSTYGPIGHGCTGTLEYMAPEVVLKKPYTYTADVWSFAVCAYALMHNGNGPFDADPNDSVHNTRDFIIYMQVPADTWPVLQSCFVAADKRPSMDAIEL